MRTKTKKKPRTAFVECATPAGYRWLRCNARGATLQADNSFLVTDEGAWSESMQAAGGKEI
jgi:hypothetical protein